MNLKVLALVALGMIAGPTVAGAAPITYTFTESTDLSLGVAGPEMAVELGAGLFVGRNFALTFTFQGDTNNVLSFTTPGASGDEILVGTASVSLTNSNTGAVLAHGTFLPPDGIYVGVDNTNGGLSFGAGGVPPSAAGFPGDVAYPFGMEVCTNGVTVCPPGFSTYDLTTSTSFSTVLGGYNVPNLTSALGPHDPYPLALDTGVLNFPTYLPNEYGSFTAVLGETSVPEPATLSLLVLGLAGVGFARRKRTK